MTLEQHGFELWGSTYIWISFLFLFFNAFFPNRYTAGLLYPGVSQPLIQWTTDRKHYFQCTVGNPLIWRVDYALFYTISYKGLEHLWILYPWGLLDSNLHGYRGTTKFFGESKVTSGFSSLWGSVPPTFVVQGSTVCFLWIRCTIVSFATLNSSCTDWTFIQRHTFGFKVILNQYNSLVSDTWIFTIFCYM